MKTGMQKYIDELNIEYRTGKAKEHSYRPAIKKLVQDIDSEIVAVNEAKHFGSKNQPDFTLIRKDVEIAFIEAKDIGNRDLEGRNEKKNKVQFDKYKKENLLFIFTDYLDFHFYEGDKFIKRIRIGEVINGKIIGIKSNYEELNDSIIAFCGVVTQTITSPEQLAKKMALYARGLALSIEKALLSEDESYENNTLHQQLKSFKHALVHDISPKEFADVYSQTIAYGMFVARLMDDTPKDFSRQEAVGLIPKSHEFLRFLFNYIAGLDIDPRIVNDVDSLINVFLHTDVNVVLKNYGKSKKQTDPIIHFYETFLTEYNPKLRKSRGVWYTPEPVVNFIVRAVDDILKTEFDLKQGLADTSKITRKVDIQGKKAKQEVHKVQILDPACGTGTFLAEVVKLIHNRKKGNMGGWNSYVEKELKPRLNGFEILMASYTMAHLKLDLLLKESGYNLDSDKRFNIFLTNSLEEHGKEIDSLFSYELANEANQANRIKRDTPVMCVIGNPPYAVSSSNASKGSDGKKTWIGDLIDVYKKNLNERKINLDDDYIKFIRYGQHYVEKNGSGILAYISNNSFIDGITHRQMRKNLLETFDKIYILDLHGNAKKKETHPDGSADQNVFDIMQGVSINIFVKTGKKKKGELGQIFHNELYGKRDFKYNSLLNNITSSIKWDKLENIKPHYFFVPKDFHFESEYNRGFFLEQLFIEKSAGIESIRDSFTIHFKLENLKKVVFDFFNLSEQEIATEYNTKDSRDWKISRAKNDIESNINVPNVWQQVSYRPFDKRITFYTGRQNGFVCNGRFKVMKHMLQKNIGLVLCRRQNNGTTGLLTENLIDQRYFSAPGAIGKDYIFPLYLYPDTNGQQSIADEETHRKPNLNPEMVSQIAKGLGLEFVPDHEQLESPEHDKYFSPLDLLDYIYAVLHSPSYREKYKEFLKIDFPRVPYPKDAEKFWKLVALGGEIRGLHLLETIEPEDCKTNFNGSISDKKRDCKIENKIGKKFWKLTDETTGKISINDKQYFDNIPLVAWEFYIGGYQPAQKWLKDRVGRILNDSDIEHYRMIIHALTETDRLMKEIDIIGVE